MADWSPILVLPNVDMRGSVKTAKAALTKRDDTRVQEIIKEHPSFGSFLSKFKGQFGEKVYPSILLLRKDAGASYFTATAVSAFRDLVACSVVPLARARRLKYVRPQPLAYSNIFAFYPWMIDKNFDDLIISTPAVLGTHLLSEFKGQSFPEQSQASVFESDIDVPLAKALLATWTKRYGPTDETWEDRALFRSLNMANEAARMPAVTAATFYEFGRSLALWVSAFEILTHPGGEGEANIHTVFAALKNASWTDETLAEEKYPVGKKQTLRNLACLVCDRIYALRNDFLHGNEVTADQLTVGKEARQMIDYAACLYRFALAARLKLTFPGEMPCLDEPKKFGKYIADHMAFESPQKEYEDALETFL
jgi:hypothetical protein